MCHSWDQKGVDEETAGRLTLCIIRSLNDEFDILVYVVGMFSILYQMGDNPTELTRELWCFQMRYIFCDIQGALELVFLQFEYFFDLRKGHVVSGNLTYVLTSAHGSKL